MASFENDEDYGAAENNNDVNNNNPSEPVQFVRITSQPVSVYKMRHKGDRKTSSSLYSEHKETSHDNKYPKIEIVNCRGPATLFVTCVNNCEPYHMHPHKLIGESCKSGIATFHIGHGQTVFELSGMNIEYTKKTEVETRFEEIKATNFDPFKVGHDFDAEIIDLNNVRLCFQVYLNESLDLDRLIASDDLSSLKPLEPVVSNSISNILVKPRLQIVRAENMYSPASGGKTVVIFLKKLEKDQRNLCVKFYDKSGWSKLVKISENLIHYRCAVMFNAPKYKQLDIKVNEPIFLKLYVPFASDKERDEFLKEKKNSDEIQEDEDEKDDDDLVCRYKSKRLLFLYTPIANLTKQKLNLSSFFSFVDKDTDSINEINQMCRIKLARRTVELLYQNAEDQPLITVPSDSFQNDSVSINHIIKYTNDLDLMSTNEVELGNEDNLLIMNQIKTILEKGCGVVDGKAESEATYEKSVSIQTSNSDKTLGEDLARLGKIVHEESARAEKGDEDQNRVYFDKLFNF